MSKPKFIIYDNEGKTFDRFTVLVPVKDENYYDVYTMSQNADSPQGVNIYHGTHPGGFGSNKVEGAGEKLKTIPDAVKRGLKARAIK